jgi:hypothetical protein
MASFYDLQQEVKRRSTRNQGGTQFDDATKFALNAALFRTAREAFWRGLRRTSSFNTVTSYTTGTGAVSVTNNSTSFSVTGATFLTDGIGKGRRISFGTDSRVYEIATITGETTGTITQLYAGTTSTTTSYEVYPKEEYVLPVQAGHRMFMWHDQYGYPQKMEYVTEQDFRERCMDDTRKDIPLYYRMWGEDMAIQQPVQASVVTLSSSSASDTSVPCTVFGTVSGYPDFEVITVTGTGGVSGSKSFSSIERIVKSSTSVGRITATTNSASVIVAVLPVGNTTTGVMYPKVQIWPLPNAVFPIKVLYYKDPYKLVNNGDVHELGDQFDEALILLAVSKVMYEQDKGEGDQFFQLWMDEIKSLKRTNVDKTDFLVTLRRAKDSNYGRNKYGLGRGFSPIQAGGQYGYPMGGY